MPSRRARRSADLMTRSTELALAVPQVVAHRVARLAMAGPFPSARDREEFARMTLEKAAAAGESWGAMATQALRAQQTVAVAWWRAWAGFPFVGVPSPLNVGAHLHSAALGVLLEGMSPVHRRAVANAKRLLRGRAR